MAAPWLSWEKSTRNIVVLEADLGKSTMTCYFEQAFPKRFFEMGIAEANMTSFAAGLSLTGKIPFTNSFAVFAAGRAYDQIRQGICIPGLNVKIVGSSAGLSDFGDGSTHQAIEDVAIMRAIPNLTVLVPMDGIEARKMTCAIAEYQGPVYLRLNRDDLPDLSSPDEPFVIGKPYLIREGTDVVDLCEWPHGFQGRGSCGHTGRPGHFRARGQCQHAETGGRSRFANFGQRHESHGHRRGTFDHRRPGQPDR